MYSSAVKELNRHVEQLQRAQYLQYKDHLVSLVTLLNTRAPFASIMATIRASEPDFDPDEWIAQHLSAPKRGRHHWPDTEIRCLKVFARSLERMVEEGNENPLSWGSKLILGMNFDEAVGRVTTEIVVPVLDYIRDHIGTAEEMLHLLGRFQRQVEWFEQEELFRAYTANTSQGEEVYDKRLRRFLFESGIDFPYSKARSASGEADIVSQLEQDDPLICEIKLFDNDAYKVARIRDGFKQAIRYAKDFNKSVAYLVVINLSDVRLTFPTDGAPGKPPRLLSENVGVFLVAVHGKPRPSASKERKVETLAITREQLLLDAAAEDASSTT